jgi:hypothetical protein
MRIKEGTFFGVVTLKGTAERWGKGVIKIQNEV